MFSKETKNSLNTLPRSWSISLWQKSFLLMVISGRAWMGQLVFVEQSQFLWLFLKIDFAILGVHLKENSYSWFLINDNIFLIYSKMSVASLTRVEKAQKAWSKQILSQRYQTFYYILGRCYRRTKIKNSHFLFNLPPELPNQFLENAIIEIYFILQKSIVPSKLYQKSPLVEMAPIISI